MSWSYLGNASLKCFMAFVTIKARTHPSTTTATRYTLASLGLITKDMIMAKSRLKGARMHILRIIW